MGVSQIKAWDFASPLPETQNVTIDLKSRAFLIEGGGKSTCLTEAYNVHIFLAISQLFVLCVAIAVLYKVYCCEGARPTDRTYRDRMYTSGGYTLIACIVLRYQYGTRLVVHDPLDSASEAAILCVPHFSVFTDSVLSNLVVVVATICFFSVLLLGKRWEGKTKSGEVALYSIGLPIAILLFVSALNVAFEDRWTQQIWDPRATYKTLALVSRSGKELVATLEGDEDDFTGRMNRWFLLAVYGTVFYVLNRAMLETYLQLRGEDTIPEWLKEPVLCTPSLKTCGTDSSLECLRSCLAPCLASIVRLVFYHVILLGIPVWSCVLLTLLIHGDAVCIFAPLTIKYPSDRLSQSVTFLNFCLNVVLLQVCVFHFCVAFPPPTLMDIFGTASQDVQVKDAFTSLMWLASVLFLLPHCLLLSCDASKFCSQWEETDTAAKENTATMSCDASKFCSQWEKTRTVAKKNAAPLAPCAPQTKSDEWNL